jgi:hypothetical protein
MGKAYWRIIQDEIEAKGWTVTRAVTPQPMKLYGEKRSNFPSL